MKKKIIIKFLDDKPREFDINIRDPNHINIINTYKSSIIKNKKKYNRKSKYKEIYE